MVNIVPDINCITADFLIKNLEYSFKEWEAQQSKHFTFDEFCEYILPYRNFTEKLEDWREVYDKKFIPKNGLSFKLDVRTSVNRLNDLLTGCFVSSYSYEAKDSPVSYLSPSQMLFRKRGPCEDMVSFTSLAFRSQGIPCRIDMVPFHGTSTGRHYWNAVIDEKHQVIPFEGVKGLVENFTLKSEPSKVITITYSKQLETLASQIEQSEIPKGFLRNKNYRDVTQLYWRVRDVHSTLFKNYFKKVAYINVLNGLSWCPAYWGKIDKENKVTFPNMGCGAYSGLYPFRHFGHIRSLWINDF